MIAVGTLLFSAACGKRGAPVPPRDRTGQRAQISGFQRGNQVILLWPMPLRNASRSNVNHIARVDVFRLAEPTNVPLELSEEEFASRSTLITTIPVTDADFGAKSLQYRDTLQFAGQSARIRYAVRYVNAAGQRAPFSNVLLIEPASKIAAAPSALDAAVSQDAITLTWQAPTTNIDASTPVSIIGYNVYRSTSETQPAKKLNQDLISDTEFQDEFFEFDRNYFYFVRAVSAGLQAEPVESIESNIVRIRPKDTFEPSAPAAVTIAAAPGTISLFWAVNPENDIAGYKIYRTTDSAKPKAQWELMTPELLKTNTFQDKRIEAGTRYYYYLTATDTAGNVSPPSVVVDDTAP